MVEHFPCQQANVACSLLASQFGYVNLASGETGKEKSDQAPILEKQCWPLSPGIKAGMDIGHLKIEKVQFHQKLCKLGKLKIVITPLTHLQSS